MVTDSREGDEPDLEEQRVHALVASRLFDRDAAPLLIGRFTVLERVGRGGMGEVYAAYDPQLDRRVAVKLLHRRITDDGLLREARTMASINHPNVAQVYEVGRAEDRIFIAMEFVRGKTLRAWRDSANPSWWEIVAMYRQAAEGLGAAHAAGIVHRDFKPDNAIVGEDGRVRVVDFGLARAGLGSEATLDPSVPLEEPSEMTTPVVGAIAGTPAYMAPEQLRGEEGDHRTDQFSFCVALHEALHGARPYRGSSIAELRRSAEDHRVDREAFDPMVPSWVVRPLLLGLHPDPAARHRSMAALLLELDRDPSARRRKTATVLATGALVVGAVALGQHVATVASRCPDPSSRLDGIWDDSARAGVHEALASQTVVFASDTATRVTNLLDAYANEWIAGHRDACEATYEHKAQSETLLDQRMRCLEDRRRSLRAVVGILAIPDPANVEQAVSAVGDLPLLASCSDADYVAAMTPLPDDPVLVSQIEERLDDLAHAEALRQLGRLDAAREIALAVTTQAMNLDYGPLLAAVHLRRGSIELDRAEIETAEALLRDSYFLARRVGADTIASEAAKDLAFLLVTHTDRMEEARSWGRLAEIEAVRIGDLQQRASALNVLGIVYIFGNESEASGEAFREALTILEQTKGTSHPETITVRANLARHARFSDQWDLAITLLEECVAHARQALGDEHPIVLTTQLSLADFLITLDRVSEASELAQRNVRMAMELYGGVHPMTVKVQEQLGRIARLNGDVDDAADQLEQALTAVERLGGFSVVKAQALLAELAKVRQAQGKLAEAEELLRRDVAETDRVLGPLHRDGAVARGELARLLVAREKFFDALHMIGEALEIFEGGGDVSEALLVRAEALHGLGRTEEARSDLERSLRLREEVFGPESAKSVDALVPLAELALERRQVEQALRHARRAMEILEGIPDIPPWNRAIAELTLAKASWEAGEHAHAVALGQIALAGFRAGPPSSQEQAAQAASWLSSRAATAEAREVE